MVKLCNTLIVFLCLTTGGVQSATLRDFYERGISNNLTIQSARQAYEQQRTHQKQAWGLWLPQIEAKAFLADSKIQYGDTGTFASSLLVAQGTNSGNDSPRSSLEYVGAKQRIFDMPSLRTLQMAGKEKLVSQLVYELVRQNFLYKLTTLYFNALSAKEIYRFL